MVEPISVATRRSPAYYGEAIDAFLQRTDDEVLGILTAASQFAVDLPDKNAWMKEIGILREALAGRDGAIFLEFDVPRLGSRIDAVVVLGAALIPVEFKCGADEYTRAAYNQAWDYGLDLKNFHSGSHELEIFPILVATEAEASESYWDLKHVDGVHPPLRSSAEGLRSALTTAVGRASGSPIVAAEWAQSPYQPSPSIIEAAQALYARHSVEAISRSDAGAKNLRVTSHTVESIVDRARKAREKTIVFVTGVPGAGKTLVGLNIATRHRRADEPTHAVFLSGNGPLVAVLQEALTRDEFSRQALAGGKPRKGAVRQAVKPFIQNVHHFRDDGVRDRAHPPADHVVIFDEAQRAWNEKKTTDFMQRRKKIPNFGHSEPEFLVSLMDRHQDWAVVVCLVGGGQEIHTGEAGISAWLDTIRERFIHWKVFISPHLTDSEYSAGDSIDRLRRESRIEFDEDLHLSVSMRSFRAESVSAFVKALLDLESVAAETLLAEVLPRYPIAVTRDLHEAKRWIKRRARGSERYGLVASSQAQRLKPHAVDVRVDVDPVHWFLGDDDDTRSSYYLEDAATEFQIQGLELDWICMTWDADLRMTAKGWSHHDFVGSRWRNMGQEVRRQYLVNAYRVLLTRARQGMVIFVPPGDTEDPTRPPAFYDRTFEYLRDLGIPDASQT